MMTISIIRLLLFILTFWSTGSNGNKVDIFETGLSADDKSFECGESIVLTCIINDFSQFMSWQNDSSTTPLAQCALGVCLFDEQSKGIFDFTYNTNLAVFNLTIFQTTFENDGTTYRCEDISTGNFSSSTIKVSDYLPITLEESADNITVTSGCIDPSTEVDIVWFKVKSDTGEESEYNPTSILMPVNQVVCATENICSLSTYIQITTTIGINQYGKEAYKLKAVMFYNGERKESNTTNTVYMVKAQESPNLQSDNTDVDWRLILGTVLGSVSMFGISVGGVVFCVYCCKKSEHEAKSRTNKSYPSTNVDEQLYGKTYPSGSTKNTKITEKLPEDYRPQRVQLMELNPKQPYGRTDGKSVEQRKKKDAGSTSKTGGSKRKGNGKMQNEVPLKTAADDNKCTNKQDPTIKATADSHDVKDNDKNKGKLNKEKDDIDESKRKGNGNIHNEVPMKTAADDNKQDPTIKAAADSHDVKDNDKNKDGPTEKTADVRTGRRC